MADKIKTFTDLIAWQKAHQFALAIHKVSKEFPRDELYGLTSQIRRASLSVSSNIAEGFSRRTSKDKTQFYYIALGSLTETQNQILFARDVGYLPETAFLQSVEQAVEIHKLFNGLIKSINHA